MKKRNSTKRALLLSALSLIMCVSMLVGSTFAWFTDSVTSGKNKIVAGNLDVQLFYTYDPAVAADANSNAWVEVNANTDIYGYNLWEPGYTKVAYFKVKNNGSLALKYQLAADVYEEKAGKNKDGAEFLLSDYIKTALVSTTATRDDILALPGTALKASFGMGKGSLEANGTAVVGMAIWMPTSVGNVANHNGTDVPEITFGINLIATQFTKEADSFNDQYDVNATYPLLAWGFKPIDPTAPFVEMDLLRTNGGKAGFARFPKDALDTSEENVTVSVIEQQSADPTVTVTAGQVAKTYEITVTGLKAGNQEKITVILNVGANLSGVVLYHNNLPVDIGDYSYDPNTGNITFQTTSFSPFTVVRNAVTVDIEIEGGEGEGEGEGNEPITEAFPKANIKPITEEIKEWTAFGGFSPADPTQQLDAVYEFTAPHTAENVDESYYADWYCDYYVMAKSDKLDTLPENSITLGGNYGSFGWVGFGNPEVPTNMEIPLLGSVTGGNEEGINTYWTYANVVKFVEVFKCGVAKSNGTTTDLSDVEFVVELRLTNPENTSEHITAGYVTYKFATGESSVYSIVYTSNELLGAIMSGNNSVILGTNIDLNNGSIVIPGN